MKLTNNWRYRSTIKSRPFLYLETKKLAQLKLKDVTEYEMKKVVVDNNILQTQNIARRKEIATVILKRLDILSPYLLEEIEKNTVETSKAIVLYSIIKTDRLFYEFILKWSMKNC